MKRWFWKRWVWAVVVGTTAAVGITVAQQGGTDAPSGPPKVGDVITLKFRDMPDRQVKVLKSDKQPDGSYLSEVKDTKSGETFTLLDKPDVGESPKSAPTPTPAVLPSKLSTKAVESKKPVETPKTVEPAKPAEPRKPSVLPKLADGPAKAKPRTSDPLVPAVKDTMSDMAKDIDKDKEKEKERRFFPSLGKSSANPSTPQPPSAAPAPEPEEERQGVLKRVFGRKKPTAPAAPAASAFPANSTSAKPVDPRPAMPSAIRPAPTVTLEPPRTQAVRPVEPPTPIIPTPVTVPTGPANTTTLPPLPIANVPTPAPVPLPAIPSVPSLGVPAPAGVPSIPVPPGGTSKSEMKSDVATADGQMPVAVKEDAKVLPAPAGQPVVPATRVVATPAVPVVTIPTMPAEDPVVTAMMRDIEPHLKSLQNGPAPSHRAIAARALSGCRHSSTDLVKMSLFRAAQNDGNPMVRAVCIEELVKLGYYEPAFTMYLTKAAEETSEEVRKAAKDALHQMQPRR